MKQVFIYKGLDHRQIEGAQAFLNDLLASEAETGSTPTANTWTYYEKGPSSRANLPSRGADRLESRAHLER
jgi:hypothetical protein